MNYDVIVVGGGIVGTATALSILEERELKLAVLESEDKLAAHQTGNNSGVIHSGLYYKPGSLKAENCVKGRKMLLEFCDRKNIKYDICGKLVTAVDKNEVEKLNELERRGRENGLEGLKRLAPEEIKKYEPNAAGIDALHVPETGIIDFEEVTKAYGEEIEAKGGEIFLNTKFKSLKQNDEELTVVTNRGEFKTKYLVNCAGLFSDKVAAECGVKPDIKIIPFRGEYYEIKEEKHDLVKNLIYPVPDPKFPFLGVHFTRMINGGVEAGPNAVLAFARKGYKYSDINFKTLFEMFFYPGFLKMAFKYYKMGFGEYYRSLSKSAFVKALQKLIPVITADDIKRGGAGVRAQALDKNGKLLDDFRIKETDRMVHVLNAPSPAATASLSIGNKIADILLSKIDAS